MDEFQQNNLTEGEAPKAPNAPTFEREAAPSYGSDNVYNAPNNNPQVYKEEPVSLGTWIGIILLGMVPCVNLIMLFVWAFSEGKKSRQNYARAALIVTGIVIVLYFLFAAVFGAAFLAAMSSSMSDLQGLM